MRTKQTQKEWGYNMENKCVVCGAVIPEGNQICGRCAYELVKEPIDEMCKAVNWLVEKAADMATVVRCKDCRNWKVTIIRHTGEKQYGFCKKFLAHTEENGFCNYAERIENENA